MTTLTRRPLSALSLPRLQHPDPILVSYCDRLARAVEIEIQRLSSTAGTTAYTLTNFTVGRTGTPTTLTDPAGASRALDPTTATTTQTATVLATLLIDLKAKGIIA